MPSIKAIRAGSRFLELTSPELESLDGLFDIDTVNLLLGKNGTGKTRLLLDIANGLVVDNTSTRFYLSSQVDSHDIICIYYSGLPYRRKLPSHTSFIDASPPAKAQSNIDEEKILQLKSVAKALDIDSKLTGVISYTSKIYRDLLIPALVKTASISNEVELTRLIHKYNEREFNSPNDIKSAKEQDLRDETLLKDIEDRLSVLISRHLEESEKLLWLSSLEFMYEKSRSVGLDAADAFLCYIGIISGPRDIVAFDELEEIVERTRRMLKSEKIFRGFTNKQRSHSFLIKTIDRLSEIKLHKTPIKIEWTELSSGLHALIDQFSLIGKAIAKAAARRRLSVLLLIDEGDVYLHLDWQRKYFSLLNRYLGDLKKRHNLRSLQLIMASHSPILAADLPGDIVTNLDNGPDETVKRKTFAAPIENIIADSFESSSLGEFAARKINETYQRAKTSKLKKIDHTILRAIGDKAILSALEREINNDN